MLTVRTIVNYKKPVATGSDKPRMSVREQRKLAGRCLQCGRRKPCQRCNSRAQELKLQARLRAK